MDFEWFFSVSIRHTHKTTHDGFKYATWQYTKYSISCVTKIHDASNAKSKNSILWVSKVMFHIWNWMGYIYEGHHLFKSFNFKWSKFNRLNKMLRPNDDQGGGGLGHFKCAFLVIWTSTSINMLFWVEKKWWIVESTLEWIQITFVWNGHYEWLEIMPADPTYPLEF